MTIVMCTFRENTSKSKGPHKPFHFCANLLCLVAASYNANTCKTCQSSITYFSTPTGFTRKRRPAKLCEKQQSYLPTESVWNLNKRSSTRTRKHKIHTKIFTPDSGASVSVISDASLYEYVTDISPSKQVKVANNESVSIELVGAVRLSLKDDAGKPYDILLQNVLYSPHFSGNLLSIEELYRQHKISTVFRGSKAAFITPENRQIPFSCDQHRRYQLHARVIGTVPVNRTRHSLCVL